MTASVETQGWRDGMEDAIINCPILNADNGIDQLFAVFDGHGGTVISLFCKVVLPRVMERNLKLLKEHVPEDQLIEKAFKKTIRDIDKVILSKQGHIILTFIYISGG